MIDERYGRSADMRLHDLRRDELGMPPREPVRASYMDADFAAELGPEEDAGVAESGPILVAALDAQPRVALIPGALITIVLTVVNDGSAGARDVHASLSLPAHTSYREGTFAIDGTPSGDAGARELFENGIDLGEIKPRGRRIVVLKLLVEAGVGDIFLSPHLSAAHGAVLGLRAMRLNRGQVSGANAAAERPFYEADAEELADEPFARAPNVPTLTVLQPPEFPPIVIAVPTDKPAFVVEPKPATALAEPSPEPVRKLVAPIRIESVRSVDEPPSIMGEGGPILTVRIDRKRLATLNRLFRGPSLGMIAHYLVLNALAVTDALAGDGVDGSLASFVAQQERLLSRALIATRLGKSPSLDSLSAPLPAFPPQVAAHTGRRDVDTPAGGDLLLIRALAPTDVVDLQRNIADHQAVPFLRAALLFVGLCANDVALPGERERHAIAKALTRYAPLATQTIAQIFQPTPTSGVAAPFRPTDPTFDSAARSVLEALGTAL